MKGSKMFLKRRKTKSKNMVANDIKISKKMVANDMKISKIIVANDIKIRKKIKNKGLMFSC